MTREQIEKLEGRELDELVCERIFNKHRGDARWYHYHSDPSADYTVLEHVREKWDIDAQMRFVCNVTLIRQSRVNIDNAISFSNCAHELYAKPGDYARAALLALEAEQHQSNGGAAAKGTTDG